MRTSPPRPFPGKAMKDPGWGNLSMLVVFPIGGLLST
jgi:hypothetical protein